MAANTPAGRHEAVALDLTHTVPSDPGLAAAYLKAFRRAFEPRDDFMMMVSALTAQDRNLVPEVLSQAVRDGVAGLIHSTNGEAPRATVDTTAAAAFARPDEVGQFLRALPIGTGSPVWRAMGAAMARYQAQRIEVGIIAMLVWRAFRRPEDIVAAYSRATMQTPSGSWLSDADFDALQTSGDRTAQMVNDMKRTRQVDTSTLVERLQQYVDDTFHLPRSNFAIAPIEQGWLQARDDLGPWHPDTLERRFVLALVQIRQGMFKAALHHIEEVSRHAPDPSDDVTDDARREHTLAVMVVTRLLSEIVSRGETTGNRGTVDDGDVVARVNLPIDGFEKSTPTGTGPDVDYDADLADPTMNRRRR